VVNHPILDDSNPVLLNFNDFYNREQRINRCIQRLKNDIQTIFLRLSAQMSALEFYNIQLHSQLRFKALLDDDYVHRLLEFFEHEHCWNQDRKKYMQLFLSLVYSTDLRHQPKAPSHFGAS
jgi:hypothetical protein